MLDRMKRKKEKLFDCEMQRGVASSITESSFAKDSFVVFTHKNDLCILGITAKNSLSSVASSQGDVITFLKKDSFLDKFLKKDLPKNSLKYLYEYETSEGTYTGGYVVNFYFHINLPKHRLDTLLEELSYLDGKSIYFKTVSECPVKISFIDDIYDDIFENMKMRTSTFSRTFYLNPHPGLSTIHNIFYNIDSSHEKISFREFEGIFLSILLEFQDKYRECLHPIEKKIRKRKKNQEISNKTSNEKIQDEVVSESSCNEVISESKRLDEEANYIELLKINQRFKTVFEMMGDINKAYNFCKKHGYV